MYIDITHSNSIFILLFEESQYTKLIKMGEMRFIGVITIIVY